MTAPLVIPPGHWIAASHAAGHLVACEPGAAYPCRCEDVDPDPPQWKRERAARSGENTVLRCDPYLGKRGKWAGRWNNMCPCWGQSPEGKPQGCCAYHPHNPRNTGYALLGLDGEHVRLPGQTVEVLPGERKDRRRVVDIEGVDPEYAISLGLPVDIEPEPYVRRWAHAELHCACRTPWDHMVDAKGKPLERGIGFHASCCHTNWRNSAVAAMHKRSITDPCRPPESIVDVERGVPVLRARNELGFTIWG